MRLSNLIKNKNRAAIIVAAILILIGLSLQLWNAFHDSLTADESPHIAAGYSYVRFLDNRLNPEHPPLVKILAGIPLQFIQVDFPKDSSWDGLNLQWQIGGYILYQNPNYQTIINVARFGPVFLTLLFSILFFWISRKFYGNKVALIALFLFTFSPTILAHGHLVTTDIAAAFGFFVGFWGVVSYFQKPTGLRLFFAGLTLALALASKFSTFILIPYTVIMAVGYWVIFDPRPKFIHGGKRLLQTAGVLLLAAVLLTSGYNVISQNYPRAKRVRDARMLMQEFGVKQSLSDPIETLIETPLVWGAGGYAMGLAITANRSMAGSSYFFGTYGYGGSPWYFPFAYLVKEPLALHILTLFLVFAGIWAALTRKKHGAQQVQEWLKQNFFAVAMFGLLVLYWILSIRSTINLGVRHILPVLPLTYLLVAIGMRNFLQKRQYQIFIGVLLGAFALSSLSQFPHELSYANEIVDGPKNLHKYLSDSNVDWGQDLKRLESFAIKNKIHTLHLLYFGAQPITLDPRVQVAPWPEEFDPATAHGYYAISETYLRTACLDRLIQPCPVGPKLLSLRPLTTIGNSIAVYYFK